MFRALFRQAQESVESSIGLVVNRALAAVPFVIAAGFGTAALTLYLIRAYGGETATLLMAALFSVIGLAVSAILSARQIRQARRDRAAAAAAGPAGAAEAQAQAEPAAEASEPRLGFSDVDRELITAALTSLGPVALPHVLRLVLRNIPLLLAIAAAAFVLTRPGNAEAPVDSQAAA